MVFRDRYEPVDSSEDSSDSDDSDDPNHMDRMFTKAYRRRYSSSSDDFY